MRLLTHFPPEILDIIAGQLFWAYCVASGGFGFFDRDDADVLDHLAALSRLSRSCKTFRAIAQPKLFRFLVTGAKLANALQTLNKRPDLACAVKHLHSDLSWNYKDKDWVADVTLYDRDRRELSRSVSTQAIGYGERDDIDFLTALAVAQVPNIASLSIEVDCATPLILEPQSLPCQTRLVVRDHSTRHGFYITILQGLFDGAPSLRVFQGLTSGGVTGDGDGILFLKD